MLITLITMIFITVVMIGFNALYVAGEFSAVSARKTRIIQSADQGNALARMLLPVMEDHHKLDNYIAASQVGITISSVVLGIYGQQQIAPRIAPALSNLEFVSEVAAAGIAATLVLVFLTTLQVVLGELVPKSIALRYPERIALLTAIPMRWSADIILKPLILLLNGSGVLIMKALGVHHSEGHKHVHSPEEIKYLLSQSHEGGLLDEQEHRLLESAFRFGRLRVGEIIIPRTKMVAADVSQPAAKILALAAKSDYTRIPIYEGDVDNIVGFVHLKELFQVAYRDGSATVRDILRDMTFLHETTYLDDAWNKLNEDQSYLAIIFDEYGGTVGLITREDLIEELFGELQDEFDDSETQPIKKLEGQKYRVRGDVAISYLNDRLDLSINSTDAYTLGGFFLNELGHMPKTGNEVVVDNIRLKANIVRGKSIEEIILSIEQPATEEDAQQS